MVKWMATGKDATASNEPGIPWFCDSRPVAAVIKLDEGDDGDDGYKKTLVERVRGHLSRGQAVVLVPWSPEKGSQYKWTPYSLGVLSGTPGDLTAQTCWQCRSPTTLRRKLLTTIQLLVNV
jgi:hypothetical protein